LNKVYSLRNATFNDVLILFDWANNTQVRQNAINPEKIIWEDHLKWFDDRLKNPNCQLFIFTEDELPIGQIRLDLLDECWVIDYSIDYKLRGKGLGNKIISLIVESNFKPLKAVVKMNNHSSNKIFINLGFKSNTIIINDQYFYEYFYE